MIDTPAGLHADHRSTWHRLQQLEAAAAGRLFPGRGMDSASLDRRAAHRPAAVEYGS